MNLRYSPEITTQFIKAEAHRLGFCACGVAEAKTVDEPFGRAYRQWIESGGNASMDYLERNVDKRLNPKLLMSGVRSIVSLALNYRPQQLLRKNEYQIAAYAYGRNYHDLMKQRLQELAAAVNQFLFGNETRGDGGEKLQEKAADSVLEYRCFCDTAPVLERYWALKSGIGWVGKNHQLIVPGVGSMVFLGELFLNIPLVYDHPMPSRCGKCRACIKSCPTFAIGNEQERQSSDGEKQAEKAGFNAQFLAFQCLSYQTIENRGALSEQAKRHVGNYIYGCDRCQTICPHNQCDLKTTEPHLQPTAELMGMTRERWHNLSVEDYRRLFKGSAVKRAKYEGLMRNVQSAEP